MKSSNFNVFVRIRPPSAPELHHEQALQTIGPTGIHISKSTGHVGNSTVFQSQYDHVMTESATQNDVFNLVEGRISEALDGYNTSIFAYGPTGTGKTYTMMGEASLDGCDLPDEQSGIIPRAVRLIFDKIRDLNKAATVYCSYMEIYSDKLHDLFQPYKPDYTRDPLDMVQKKAGLEIREDGQGSLFVPDLMTVRVTNAHTVEKLIERGNKNRAVRHTELNQHSSRSHTILQLIVEQRCSSLESQDQTGDLVRSKINFIDLAGSERWNTNLELSDDRISEMNFINSSLSSLVCVVSALTEKTSHIPYRCSKLTHLLKDSLGGNCKTAMIFTLSPSTLCFEETCSTLRFADRARNISNNPVINVQENLTWVIERKDKEIIRLRQLVALLTSKDGSLSESARNQLKEEESQENSIDHAAKLNELQQEVENLRRALQHERELRSTLESSCNGLPVETDNSSVSERASLPLQYMNPSSPFGESQDSDVGAIITTHGRGAATVESELSPEPSDFNSPGRHTKMMKCTSKTIEQNKDSEVCEASSNQTESASASRSKQFSTRNQREVNPKPLCKADSGPNDKLSMYLDDIRSSKKIGPCKSPLKRYSSMTSDQSRNKKKEESGQHRDLDRSSASMPVSPTSEEVVGLQITTEDSLDTLQKTVLARDSIYFCRLSDPGTSGVLENLDSLAESISDISNSHKIPGWGRSSIIRGHSKPVSPLESVGLESESDGSLMKDPRGLEMLPSSLQAALSAIKHHKELDESMNEDHEEEETSSPNHLERESTWGKNGLLGSYDSDSNLPTRQYPSPLRRGNSEILAITSHTKNTYVPRQALQRSRTQKMDAGSLIYILGSSSSSLKAKKIADILRE